MSARSSWTSAWCSSARPPRRPDGLVAELSSSGRSLRRRRCDSPLRRAIKCVEMGLQGAPAARGSCWPGAGGRSSSRSRQRSRSPSSARRVVGRRDVVLDRLVERALLGRELDEPVDDAAVGDAASRSGRPCSIGAATHGCAGTPDRPTGVFGPHQLAAPAAVRRRSSCRRGMLALSRSAPRTLLALQAREATPSKRRTPRPSPRRTPSSTARNRAASRSKASSLDGSRLARPPRRSGGMRSSVHAAGRPSRSSRSQTSTGMDLHRRRRQRARAPACALAGPHQPQQRVRPALVARAGAAAAGVVGLVEHDEIPGSAASSSSRRRSRRASGGWRR